MLFWKVLQLFFFFVQFFGELNSSIPHCETCHNNTNRSLCRCDDHCTLYNDCCPDHVPSVRAIISESLQKAVQFMTCQTRYKDLPLIAINDANYMVSSCPSDWKIDYSFANRIQIICINNDQYYDDYPPVSDSITGITYRNQYCAMCHNVRKKDIVIWSTRLVCQRQIDDALNKRRNTNIETLLNYCSRCTFDAPVNNTIISNTLRWCMPHVSTCPSFDDYQGIIYNSFITSCIYGTYDPIYMSSPTEIIYKNIYCARCNRVDENHHNLGCKYLNISEERNDSRCVNNNETLKGISAVLDVQKNGVVTLTTSQTYFVMKCNDNQIFDQLAGGGCRNISCPKGYEALNGMCLPNCDEMDCTITTTATVVVNSTINDTTDNTNRPPIINHTSDDNTLNKTDDNTNCTMIALNSNEYIIITNSSVLFRKELIDVIEYDTDGRPIVCVPWDDMASLNSNTANAAISYAAVSYIGSCVSILATLSILFTYSVFKKLRTLPIQLLMNLAVAVLIGDILILLSGVHKPSIEFCTAVSILLHFVLLARFSWMNCIGVEYTRLAVRGTNPTLKYQNSILLVYCIVGWGIPLVITGITVIINYSVLDTIVMYSANDTNGANGTNGTDGATDDTVQGLCWIDDTLSDIIAFVLPISISTIINIGFFLVIILAFLMTKNKPSHGSIRMRIGLGLLIVLSLIWIIGYVALISNQIWTWYLFIIINSNQVIFIAISFLATKKVIWSYVSTCRVKSLKLKNIINIKMETIDNIYE